MKLCKKCGIGKDVSEFPPEKRNKDGITGTCRSCTRTKAVEWEGLNADKIKACYERNKASILARKALYYEKNADLLKAKAAVHREANTERLKEYFREYSVKNSSKILDRVRDWRIRNPEKKAIHNQNRRARKISNGGKLSLGISKRLMVLQKGRCGACRCELSKSGVHLDHVIPLSLGGANSDANMQLLCPTCNMQKNRSHPVDFMRRKGFLL